MFNYIFSEAILALKQIKYRENEDLINARLVNFYLDSFKDVIQAQTQYVPRSEWEMLRATILSFGDITEDKISTQRLLAKLIEISDLMIQRGVDKKEVYPQLLKVFSTIPKEIIAEVNTTEDSLTARFIGQNFSQEMRVVKTDPDRGTKNKKIYDEITNYFSTIAPLETETRDGLGQDLFLQRSRLHNDAAFVDLEASFSIMVKDAYQEDSSNFLQIYFNAVFDYYLHTDDEKQAQQYERPAKEVFQYLWETLGIIKHIGSGREGNYMPYDHYNGTNCEQLRAIFQNLDKTIRSHKMSSGIAISSFDLFEKTLFTQEMNLMFRVFVTKTLGQSHQIADLFPAPFILQNTVAEYEESIAKEMNVLVKKIANANNLAISEKTLNLPLFFLKFYPVILDIIEIMGVEGIRHINSKVGGNSILSLERTFTAFPQLDSQLRTSEIPSQYARPYTDEEIIRLAQLYWTEICNFDRGLIFIDSATQNDYEGSQLQAYLQQVLLTRSSQVIMILTKGNHDSWLMLGIQPSDEGDANYKLIYTSFNNSSLDTDASNSKIEAIRRDFNIPIDQVTYNDEWRKDFDELLINSDPGLVFITCLREGKGATALIEKSQDIALLYPESRVDPSFHLLRQYFKDQWKANENHANQCDMFIKVLSTLNLLINKRKLLDIRYEPILQNLLQPFLTKSFRELLIELNRLFCEIIFNKQSSLLTENQKDAIVTKLCLPENTELLLAHEKMHDDKYSSIFSEFLLLDCSGGNVDRFMHDVEQENILGRRLAIHNQQIREELRSQNIVPETALDYQNTYEFIVSNNPESNLECYNHYIVFWTYLEQLLQAAEKHKADCPTSSLIRQINPILSNFDSLKQMIIKKSNEQANTSLALVEVLLDPNNKKNIEKLYVNCVALLKGCPKAIEEFKSQVQDTQRMDSIQLLLQTLREFATHTKEQYELIETQQVEKQDKKKIEMHFFQVKQWDKKDASTFFLGNAVGCCLATNGTQFPAIVQRRMDDAMLFHVAIDKITNQPIALIWLYLARLDNGKIGLIANFFEVNSRFGNNDHVRKSILNGLLQFTSQYLQDNPNIAGFYMNKLTYGWNTKDLLDYPLQKVTIINKLGGAFSPENLDFSSSNSSIYSHSRYYLNSLMATEFHAFDSKILVKNKQGNVIELDTLVKTCVFNSMKTMNAFEEVVKAVLKQHRIELEPFFTKPIEQDPKFEAYISTVFKEISAGHASKTQRTSSMGLFSSRDLPRLIEGKGAIDEYKGPNK